MLLLSGNANTKPTAAVCFCESTGHAYTKNSDQLEGSSFAIKYPLNFFYADRNQTDVIKVT